MAQLNKKYQVLIIIAFAIAFISTALFLLPISSVETSDKNNYLLSLDGINYSDNLNLKYGKYEVYVKTPYHIEKTDVKINFFDNIVLDVENFETEGGIDQVAQQVMGNNGFPGTEINRCSEIEKLHYVCESYQLSSTRAIELIYTNAEWSINLDPNKSQNTEAKNLMISINQNNSQR
jgi:hypothetical protein